MSGAPRPIVVIDDDQDFAVFVARIVRDAGWHVLTFTDARAAEAALLEELHPALVLVDLMMPHVDGEEFALWFREVWQRRKGEAVPLVLLSAAWTLSQVRERIGADAVLSKPFSVEELRDVCVRFAQAHRLRSETDPPRSP